MSTFYRANHGGDCTAADGSRIQFSVADVLLIFTMSCIVSLVAWYSCSTEVPSYFTPWPQCSVTLLRTVEALGAIGVWLVALSYGLLFVLTTLVLRWARGTWARALFMWTLGLAIVTNLLWILSTKGGPLQDPGWDMAYMLLCVLVPTLLLVVYLLIPRNTNGLVSILLDGLVFSWLGYGLFPTPYGFIGEF